MSRCSKGSGEDSDPNAGDDDNGADLPKPLRISAGEVGFSKMAPPKGDVPCCRAVKRRSVAGLSKVIEELATPPEVHGIDGAGARADELK